MDELQNATDIVVNKCLALKQEESCLVITDENKKGIGKLLYDAAQKISNNVDFLEIPVGKANGEEPPSNVSKKMREYDVLIIPTTMSLSHTNARIEATKLGVRIATLPGITKDILTRTINVDYDEMKEITNKIADVLDAGKTVKITTQIGTDITMNIDSAVAHGRKAGLFTKEGYWGNLPDAEAFLAPVQTGTNGVYVVDTSHAGVGKLNEPIKIRVQNGFAVKIEGGDEAKKLREVLEDVNDKNAYNIAELGIGTNKKAKITGVVLEDEKVFGTCHIALGKNDSFGGDVNVPLHLDGVIKEPTIIVDGKEIMLDGKLLI